MHDDVHNNIYIYIMIYDVHIMFDVLDGFMMSMMFA